MKRHIRDNKLSCNFPSECDNNLIFPDNVSYCGGGEGIRMQDGEGNTLDERSPG